MQNEICTPKKAFWKGKGGEEEESNWIVSLAADAEGICTWEKAFQILNIRT